jgi:hypothetical protein
VVLSILVLLTLESTWLLPFLALAVAHLLTQSWETPWQNSIRRALTVLTLLIPFVVLVGWLTATRLPWAFLAQPWPAIFALLCLVGFLGSALRRRGPAVAFALLVLASSVNAANSDVRDGGESGADWDQVRTWIKQQTPKSAKFVTTAGGFDFGVVSLRTSVNSGAGALVWIDPQMLRHYRARMDRVQGARKNGTWDVPLLTVLAREWGASYILLKGTFTPAEAQPLCKFGAYTVFPVDTSLVCCSNGEA